MTRRSSGCSTWGTRYFPSLFAAVYCEALQLRRPYGFACLAEGSLPGDPCARFALCASTAVSDPRLKMCCNVAAQHHEQLPPSTFGDKKQSPGNAQQLWMFNQQYLHHEQPPFQFFSARK